MKFSRLVLLVLIVFPGVRVSFAQQPSPSPTASPAPQTAVSLDEWRDDFDGQTLEPDKWERFSIEGGGGKVEVKDGQLRMRGMIGSRSGVRSKLSFAGDRFIVEASIAKVGAALPDPGQSVAPPGNAILTLLFGGSDRNRLEWILTSEGTFEAWAAVDGRLERLDNRSLATKTPNPTLSIARKGDDYFFALNGQIGLHKTIKDFPRAFRVMLYGYGSSENDWESVHVVTPKQSK